MSKLRAIWWILLGRGVIYKCKFNKEVSLDNSNGEEIFISNCTFFTNKLEKENKGEE